MELNDKFQNIEKLQANEELKHYYVTVKSCIDYEKNKNIYMVNQNATLSLLRLNRGLEFIRKFLENMYHNQDNKKKSYELAYKAYEDTLSFRHHWAVRRLVSAGLYLLPNKAQLIDLMLNGIENKSNRKLNDEIFLEFLELLEKIYSVIHKEFDENNFLELVIA